MTAEIIVEESAGKLSLSCFTYKWTIYMYILPNPLPYSTEFSKSWERSLLKTLREKEKNAGYQHFLPCPKNVFLPYFSLTADHSFNIGCLGKQLVTYKEYCAKYLLKKHQESMGRCTWCAAV